MCILTAHDDIEPPTLAEKASEAFDRLEAAQRAVLRLAVRVDSGSTVSDPQINRVLGELTAARYMADEAVCSLMYGEPYRPTPTSAAMRIEIQSRSHRNARFVAQSLPAVGSFATE